jgi:hypothetical protein
MTRTRAFALVGIAVAAALVPLPRALVERWYSTLAYPLLQRTITPISSLVPFALFDALLIAAVCGLAVLVHRHVGRAGWKAGLLRTAGDAIVAAAVAYLAFVAMWGLNYRRVPLTEKVVFDPARINRSGAQALGEANVLVLNRLYAQAHRGEPSSAALAESFQTAVRQMDARAPIALARPKETLLGGYFHQISVSGMTDPFFLETLIASDLLEVERPFVVAHEWAHLAGYADESEANFIAWLACRHGDAAAQYSGALAMIGYAPPGRALRDALDIGPRIDLWAIQLRYAGTNRMLRVAARRSYDTYLKANRVEKGVESYDAVVQLILGTALDSAGYPRRR